MAVNPDHRRVEEFKSEIADMRVPDPATGRDRLLTRLGAVLMVVGVVTACIAYLLTHSTTSPVEQRDYVVVALIGICLTIAGGFCFLRGSLAQFLRFWFARLSCEQQMAVDRLLDGSRRDS